MSANKPEPDIHQTPVDTNELQILVSFVYYLEDLSSNLGREQPFYVT